MFDLSEQSCTAFIDALASREPVPGGGGASALVGALGCALGTMVGNLTAGKARYAAVQDDMIRLVEKATALQDRLVTLINADAEAFMPLARTYGLPTDTEEQRALRTQLMQESLRACCDVPLRIMEACGEAIELHEQFALKSSVLAISDVGAGVLFAKAALQGASLNVFINTKLMEDRALAQDFNARARALLDTHEAQADRIYGDVAQRCIVD
jgi:formiminotetrahydrofolate cyclodeaminase